MPMVLERWLVDARMHRILINMVTTEKWRLSKSSITGGGK